ncbi:LptA/OstA family protein [Stakelama sp. CBK3Z-3]|uniref:LptA/OstA family protein n=1 Tax=Stakelama flava TaxID=2860338 RepID=A0ABS6XK71_9SPHN|nr:LptA/OstA family protein [Stakelama flava]MBW4330597.1 LptA/OstA family protein [Stakelama flava]
MTRPIALIAFPGVLALAAGASAQTRHNSSAPIDVSAAHIELQDKANRAVLSGDVAVKQAEMTLNAARMTVHYTGQVVGGSPQVSRLDASGNVVITRPDQTARSQYAVYDLNSRVVTLLGNVTLNQGGNVLNGGRVNIDLDTGRATIDGSSVGSSRGQADGGVTRSNGRVTGRFSVPDRK